MTASHDCKQYCPFAFSAYAYIRSNGDLLYVRPCAAGLYWNQEAKICDRKETSPVHSAEDQPESYQISYNSQQPKLTYNRPLVSFVDQSIGRQQVKTFNQIRSRGEVLVMKTVFSSSFMMKQNRRLQNQQQLTPINTYSSMYEQQQPIVSDQQYDQSLNQPTAAFIQPISQRSMLHVFQSSSYP
ncbi:unnamed protein product [Rotaria sordida]|uniref:Chitin-binding type-2 domain-containing protein n=2 Tax=Rotaria sordida TaxID=392033 RepID=A0A818XI52_9BILA|nr:unnamed protein product [Rotaria sordida]CAF3737412.1 unnamed protein product [Rotaria sordida]